MGGPPLQGSNIIQNANFTPNSKLSLKVGLQCCVLDPAARNVSLLEMFQLCKVYLNVIVAVINIRGPTLKQPFSRNRRYMYSSFSLYT